MRATTLLTHLLGVQAMRVREVAFTTEGIVLDVAPTARWGRCWGCGRRVRKVHDRRVRLWRHLDLGGARAWLRYAIRRLDCARCGVRTELVPWATYDVGFTHAFEETVAYLAQRADRAAVAAIARTTWPSVAMITGRVLARESWDDRLDGLVNIGVDEVSYRRGQHYLTVVVDHDRRRVVWVEKGHAIETLRAFFERLGNERISALRTVTLDLSAAYRIAVEQAAPLVRLIFDRFHVQRLAHLALDEVRRAQMRALAREPGARWIKGTRWILHKRPRNLLAEEIAKLVEVERHHPVLYRAYLLKEELADMLDSADVTTARQRFAQWHRRALRSRLAPFRRVAHTLDPLREGLFAYVASHLTNALSEGINLKIRAITHRSFGVPTAQTLSAMILLTCGDPLIDLAQLHAVLPLK